MVPRVPALAHGEERDQSGLGRRLGRVVGRRAEVGVHDAVHGPRAVQNVHVAQHSRVQEPVPQRLAPTEHGNKRRHRKAPGEVPPGVGLLLEHDERVLLQVLHIHLAPGESHLLGLLDQQPPHVRVEPAAVRVVRIRLSVAVDVVRAVVARPVVDRALVRDRVGDHEKETRDGVRVVAAVGPEPVRARGDAESGNGPEDECEKQRLPMHGCRRLVGGNVGGCEQASVMQKAPERSVCQLEQDIFASRRQKQENRVER
mmetsp:Transcript_4546/g.11094  ORF Transcript_4546/g.11094 Transcript_4546/m.11094 type:complete len:257 (+) Transcript_4546:4816-5586(+)